MAGVAAAPNGGPTDDSRVVLLPPRAVAIAALRRVADMAVGVGVPPALPVPTSPLGAAVSPLLGPPLATKVASRGGVPLQRGGGGQREPGEDQRLPGPLVKLAARGAAAARRRLRTSGVRKRKAANQRAETTIEAVRRPCPQKRVADAHVPVAVARLRPGPPRKVVEVGVGLPATRRVAGPEADVTTRVGCPPPVAPTPLAAAAGRAPTGPQLLVPPFRQMVAWPPKAGRDIEHRPEEVTEPRVRHRQA